MEAQRNDPDSSQDLLLQRVQKALRDNNRVDQINRESQGFKISKIDTETLNKLDDTAMISSTIDERTWLPAVDIDCKKGFIIRYTDPNTGEKQYIPSISLDSDTKQLKYFWSLKSTVHSTWPEDLRGEHNRDYMSGVVDKGDIFTLTSKINWKEKQESFTIMSLETAEKEKRADMYEKQDN